MQYSHVPRRPQLVSLLTIVFCFACSDDPVSGDGGMGDAGDRDGGADLRDGTTTDAPQSDTASVDAGSFDTRPEDAAMGDACSSCTRTLTEMLAFPSAMGGGSITSGGRGGAVIHVTNLDDGGSGSFRAAMETEGPRTIVFDVSGRIQLSTRIELIDVNSDFTIAGETAPRGGITISGGAILLAGGYNRTTRPTDNVIIRHVRLRNGRYTGVSDVFDHNAIISGGTDRFIFDHISFSFNDDQAISMLSNYGPLQDGTVQRCLFSENATGIIFGLERDFPVGRISTLNNLFVHQSHRTPNIGDDGRFDIINNLAFNWGPRLTNLNGGSSQVNYIANHLTTGEYLQSENSNNKIQLGGAAVAPRVYTADNFHSELLTEPQEDDRSIWSDFSSSEPVASEFFATTRFVLLANTVVLSATEARADVLADVGTRAHVSDDGIQGSYLDSYDTERIEDITNGVSRDPANKTWTQPELPSGNRPAGFYSTLPNIPEFFVRAHGISAESDVLSEYDFGDVRILNDAGYSAFEMYLFFAAGDLNP